MSLRRSEWDGWTMIGRAGLSALFRLGFRLRYAGLENIPRSGGALLTYNHVSVLDPVVVALGAARRGRVTHFLALAGLFEDGWLGWSLRKTKQIRLRRGLGDWDAIGEVADLVRSGSLAGMAPEGTVGDGIALLPGQRGAARIALLAGVPVVPVGVWGTNERWPKEGLRKDLRRPPAAVVFGRPLLLEGDARARPDVLAMTDRIMAAIAEVAAVARAGA